VAVANRTRMTRMEETLPASTSEGIYGLDRDGYCISMNRRGAAMLGYGDDELLGQKLHVLVHRAHQDGTPYASEDCPILKAIRAREFARGDELLWRRDGTPVPVRYTVSPMADVGTSQSAMVTLVDLSARYRAADPADVAWTSLSDLVDRLEDVIFSVDLVHGRILNVSPACETVYGYSEEVFRARPMLWKEVIDPADLPRVEAGIARLGQGRVDVSEYRIIRADGAMRWVHGKVKPTIDENGRLTRIDGIVSDITERKLAEAALQETNARLREVLTALQTTQQHVIQQERLHALGQMASGIAHDFNNVLAPILGFTELLLTRPADLDDRQKTLTYLRAIYTAATDAAQLVKRLQEFYRHRDEQDVRQLVDLNAVVEQVIALTEPRWNDQAQANGIAIRLETDLTQIPSVVGDATASREALTNLVLNALDAMPNGGTLRLRTWADGGGVVVEVGDTGTGMTEEVRKRCLEPFFTTKGASGTGLGLAMVFGFVRRHGGTIAIDSAVGRGTTIRLRLPAKIE
jgi:PAS domain S-box-containing protein